MRLALLALALASPLAAQQPRPPQLPDTTGWGVRVLADVTAPDGARWVGTYGRGIYVLPRGGDAWRHIVSDTAATSLSWDFVHAIAFGPGGRVWVGTVGNGWGLSEDGGRTWRNWTLKQLGPEWQYVAPDGIVTRGDTTVVATADGLQVTTDHGATWTAIVDSVGPAAKGPAAAALPLLHDEYVTALWHDRAAWHVRTPLGVAALAARDGAWRRVEPSSDVVPVRGARSALSCGYAKGPSLCPRLAGDAKGAKGPAEPRTTWFLRPIAPERNAFIDQTYRYGSTMGGNFQQHQGVEFNNADGTPVRAIGAGTVAYAGRGEAGANTVAILHDSALVAGADTFRVWSVYYHNAALDVKAGDRVARGGVVARVGNTGRATNDHLHLEVHATPPGVGVQRVVDSLNRFPPHTTNPELWIRPLPGTGIVAGTVRDAAGARVPQARVYGLVKDEPRETPYAFAETYGDKAHPHPAYGEDFAVGDVPAGTYLLAVEIGGATVRRRVKVEAGRVTWVEFAP